MNRAKIVAVDRARARDPELASGPLGIDDSRPRALRYFDKSPRCQVLNRAAYGFAAHRESRGKLTLARQFITHLKEPDVICDASLSLICSLTVRLTMLPCRLVKSGNGAICSDRLAIFLHSN